MKGRASGWGCLRGQSSAGDGDLANAGDVDGFRGVFRQINHAPSDERTAIIDAHHRAAVATNARAAGHLLSHSTLAVVGVW